MRVSESASSTTTAALAAGCTATVRAVTGAAQADEAHSNQVAVAIPMEADVPRAIDAVVWFDMVRMQGKNAWNGTGLGLR
ncbi:hypothetical protein [Cupriavidus sp. H18C1]|uniref:hypothetical protein n=1 Tax=Cupriavidus sp. H18C1 TaxID=3241601 RepID=UPI003BB8E7F5